MVTAGRTEGRVPPHDLEAESSVLGALLLDAAAITRVLDILHAEDFYRENNGQIFRAALDLFREGEPIDNVTLAAQLEKMGVLERTGGRAHLAMLQEQTPTAANVEHYARIVKDRAYKRQLISAGTQVTGLGYEDGLEAEEAVNQAQSCVYAITDDKVGSGMERLYDLLKPAMDRIDAQMAAGGAVLGVASGFHELDRMTNGFKASDMVVIAGRPSMGKALALDTPIPTPVGWKTMGELRIGDQVFDEQGRPCTVTFATPVMLGRPCYEIELSGGEVLVADGDHLWATSDGAAGRPGDASLTVRTTRELLTSLQTPDGRPNHVIPACAALRYPERHLPSDPHALGVALAAGPAAVAAGTTRPAVTVPECERLPRLYLESSVAQRTALLRGLVEAGGWRDGPGGAAFCTTDPGLAEDVAELASGLGIVASRSDEPGLRHRITFGTDRARSIEDIRPATSVPVRCIQVDSPGHLYLAGRSCVPTHNTSFALNVALHAAVEHRQPIAIFSLEMSKEQLVERMLCEQARIDAQRLHRGLLSEAEHERLVYALGPLGDAPIYIDDSPMLDDLTLRLKARQARAREGVEMVMIDYLQLMHGRQRSDDGNRVQEVSAISRSLKSIARELRIPVIALSQLSRAPEARPDKRPILSDLRESGSIEQDADLVMFLYRDEYYHREKSEKPGIAEVIIAKHRNGPTGSIELLFRKELTRFENIDRRRPDDDGMPDD